MLILDVMYYLRTLLMFKIKETYLPLKNHPYKKTIT
jgi:hypothetical protein